MWIPDLSQMPLWMWRFFLTKRRGTETTERPGVDWRSSRMEGAVLCDQCTFSKVSSLPLKRYKLPSQKKKNSFLSISFQGRTVGE